MVWFLHYLYSLQADFYTSFWFDSYLVIAANGNYSAILATLQITSYALGV
jgi:hypothetical protein